MAPCTCNGRVDRERALGVGGWCWLWRWGWRCRDRLAVDACVAAVRRATIRGDQAEVGVWDCLARWWTTAIGRAGVGHRGVANRNHLMLWIGE